MPKTSWSNMFEYLLLGTPNSGKTTLYNALCAKNEKTGNWHGVTAVVKRGSYTFEKEEFFVDDLPGIYSLEARSLEEKNTVDRLKRVKSEKIIVVIDACSVSGGVTLCEQLLKGGYKFGVILNKANGNKEKKLCEEIFGVNVVCVNSYDEKSVKNFKESVKNVPTVTAVKRVNFFQNNFCKADKYLLNPFVNIGIFITFCLLCLYCCVGNYSLGKFCSDFFKMQSERFCVFCRAFLTRKGLSGFLVGVICGGIQGVGDVFSFIPQIIILNLFLFVYEESGFAERSACVFFPLLNRSGLGVKSLFPLISGFTCTALSCELCNSCENERAKRKTLKSLSVTPCSAKITVFIFLCKTFFKNSFLALLFLFLLQATVWLAVLLYFVIIGDKYEPFIGELDKLKLPRVKSVVKKSLDSAFAFVKKTALIIALISLALSVFTGVSVNFTPCENLSDSLLALFAKKISFVFYPLGIRDFRYVVGLISGLFAKEGVIGALSSLSASGAGISFSSRCAFCVFFALYSPCLVALGAFKREEGFVFSLIIFLKNTVFGYIGAFLTYKTLNGEYLFLIIFIIFVIIFFKVSYEVKKRYGKKRRKNFANCVK